MRGHDRVAVQDSKLGLEEQYKQSASDVILRVKSLGLLAVALNYPRCHAGRKWEYTQHLKKGRNELSSLRPFL